MDVTEVRRSRLRQLIAEHGLGQLAKRLGYRQPSFLSNMSKVNENGKTKARPVSEKTARAIEAELELPVGWMDTLEDEKKVDAAQATASIDLVTDIIKSVGQICSDESVNLPTSKFADVVMFAYLDAMDHGQTVRTEHIAKIVRLLK